MKRTMDIRNASDFPKLTRSKTHLMKRAWATHVLLSIWNALCCLSFTCLCPWLSEPSMVSPSFYIFHICFIVSFCKLIVKKSFVGVIWKDKKRYKHKLVPKKLPTGIGPVTSALPMRRSTAWATAACRITQRIIIYYNVEWLSTVKSIIFYNFSVGFRYTAMRFVLPKLRNAI